jgi:hypothetical protein
MKTFRIDYHDGRGEFIYASATVEKTYNHILGDCIAFNDYTVTKDGVIVDKGDSIVVPCDCIIEEVR